jgi:transcriptional activator of cad operon
VRALRPRAIRIGEWRLRPDLGRLEGPAGERRLEPRTADLLRLLAARSGEVLTKEELLAAVWRGVHVSDETLTNAVYELRKALGDDARSPRYIQTLARRGYRLVAETGPDARPRRGRAVPATTAAVAVALALSMAGSRLAASREAAALVEAGWGALDLATAEGGLRAERLFDAATRAAPRSGEAWAGLAHAQIELAGTAGGRSGPGYRLAEAAARQALELDATQPEPYVARGLARLLGRWDWTGAEADLRRALDLDPRSGRARAALAELLLYAQRADDARREAALATALAPRSIRVRLAAGLVHVMTGDEEQAQAAYAAVLRLSPGHPGAARQIAKLRERHAAAPASADPAVLLAQVEALVSAGKARPSLVAVLLAESGQQERALEWLEVAVHQRDSYVLLVRLDPRWASLREHPRFRAAMARIGPSRAS